jgi:hypothetical protein
MAKTKRITLRIGKPDEEFVEQVYPQAIELHPDYDENIVKECVLNLQQTQTILKATKNMLQRFSVPVGEHIINVVFQTEYSENINPEIVSLKPYDILLNARGQLKILGNMLLHAMPSFDINTDESVLKKWDLPEPTSGFMKKQVGLMDLIEKEIEKIDEQGIYLHEDINKDTPRPYFIAAVENAFEAWDKQQKIIREEYKKEMPELVVDYFMSQRKERLTEERFSQEVFEAKHQQVLLANRLVLDLCQDPTEEEKKILGIKKPFKFKTAFATQSYMDEVPFAAAAADRNITILPPFYTRDFIVMLRDIAHEAGHVWHKHCMGKRFNNKVLGGFQTRGVETEADQFAGKALVLLEARLKGTEHEIDLRTYFEKENAGKHTYKHFVDGLIADGAHAYWGTYPYFKSRFTHLHAMVDPKKAPPYYWDCGIRIISTVADAVGLKGLADCFRSQMVAPPVEQPKSR